MIKLNIYNNLLKLIKINLLKFIKINIYILYNIIYY